MTPTTPPTQPRSTENPPPPPVKMKFIKKSRTITKPISYEVDRYFTRKILTEKN
jgi:hypothetical protein